MSELIYPSEVEQVVNPDNTYATNLFFANVTQAGLSDAVTGAPADVISTLSTQVGEWYQQNELTTLSPTEWLIPYPYADLAGADDSSFTIFLRLKNGSNVAGTAAVLFSWQDTGISELIITRYQDYIRIALAGGNTNVPINLLDSEEFTLCLRRDTSTNITAYSINGGTFSTIITLGYTTLDNAKRIQYHNEADQRGEGIGACYIWVDRALTQAEVVELHSNPYQLMKTTQMLRDEQLVVDELTVGAGKDYPNPYVYCAARYQIANKQRARVFGVVNVGGNTTGFMDSPTEFTGGLELIANEPFDGDVVGKTTIIGGDSEYIRWGVDGSKFLSDGIVYELDAINATSPIHPNGFRKNDFELRNFALIGKGGTDANKQGMIVQGSAGSKYRAINGLIQGWSGAGTYAEDSDVDFNATNIIARGNNTAGNTYGGGFVGSKGGFINCVGYDNGNADFYGSLQYGSNCISKDSSAVTTGLGIQDANLSTYFLVNGQIDSNNTSAMTALTGTGWNGSNIVEWSYSDPVPTGGPFTIDLPQLVSTAVFYTPVVTKDVLLEVLPTFITTTNIVYTPDVRKDHNITLDTIDSTVALYTPTVSQLVSLVLGPTFIPSTVSVYSLQLLKDKLLLLQAISTSANVRTPQLLKDKLILLNQILATTLVYDPLFPSPQFILPEYIESTTVLRVPEILGGYVPTPNVKMFPAEGYGLHIRSAEELNTVVKALVRRIEILEGH